MLEVTKEKYKSYMGEEAPENFERLKTIALSTLSSFNLNNMSTYCEGVYESAVYEQIKYLTVSDIDSTTTTTSIKLGDASETYQTKDTHSKTLSPIAKQLLSDNACNFLYAGNVSVQSCRSRCK